MQPVALKVIGANLKTRNTRHEKKEKGRDSQASDINKDDPEKKRLSPEENGRLREIIKKLCGC